MATNDFQPFAYGGAANVVSQSAYLALTTILQNGFSSGVAQSAQLNKVWRQSSIMAAVLAQFSSDYSGQNSTDDGTTATLETNLIAAIRGATKTGVLLTDTGSANAYTASNVPALTSGQLVNGLVQQVVIAHANTGGSTYAPDGLTAYPIYGLGLQALQGGELYAGGTAVLMRATIAGINSGNPIWLLMECAGGAQQVAPATQSQHALQLGQAVGRLIGIQHFVASTTYTPTAGTTSIEVEIVGGGGAGGSTNATGAGQVAIGGGGGAGGYARSRYTSGFSGVAITIGAGGTVGSPTGGTTSFGALMSATGGVQGASGANTVAAPPFSAIGGLGGVGSSGNIVNVQGGQGIVGIAAAATSFVSGAGGQSAFGMGGGAQGTTSNTGSASPSAGGGGAGALAGANTAAQNGGAGAAGVCIIREYS